MLSGTRDALEALVAQCPPGQVNLIEGQSLAVHSPLRRYAEEFTAAAVEALPIADPRVPVCSSQEQRTLRTAEEIRDQFRRNQTTTMSLPAVTREMHAVHGVQLALSPGPALPVDLLHFPFPVLRVDQSEHVFQALEAIYEYAVDVPVAM
jgi:[acyl-carrier-protein] S-malonyltransferase